MYQPALARMEELARQGNMVPVYRELPADLETPVSVYLKLQDEGPSFLLESVTGGENVARYSFLGVRPQALLSSLDGAAFVSREGDSRTVPLGAEADILSVLRAEMAAYKPVTLPELPPFTGGAVGYLSYDVVRYFERLPATARDGLHIPDAAFMFTDTLVVFDHARHRLLIISNVNLREGDLQKAYRRATARIDEIVARLHAPLPELPPVGDSGLAEPEFVSNFTQSEYEEIVRKAKKYIAAGDIFQVVPSQRLSRRTSAHPFNIYRALRRLNPSPYMVFLRFPGGFNAPPLHIIAASPEMHVRYDATTHTAELRPIAGTRPRGSTPAEDEALATELLADEKERAEHVMLVDLGRNDLGRVCQYGTVSLKESMTIERYSHVMHIVSHVQGKLQPGKDAFDLLRATFPAGTVSGAPKVRAMEIIEELEGTRRGPYAGAIAYVGYNGALDSCIAIRTLWMKGNTVYLQCGGGVVADSDPTCEYQEALHKARALSVAVTMAEQGK
jgi:anthranilate synthase component 1